MTAKNATELLRNRAAGGGVKQLDRDRLTGRRRISLPAPPPPGLVVKLLYSGTRGGAKEKKKTENTRGVILSFRHSEDKEEARRTARKWLEGRKSRGGHRLVRDKVQLGGGAFESLGSAAVCETDQSETRSAGSCLQEKQKGRTL